MKALRVALIGLDTSHTVQFAKLMNAPDCPPAQRVPGMVATRCLRFETPFQDAAGLDARTAQIEAWGVRVTEDFDTAVAECDAVMLEINDPAFHVEYFERAAELGKPVFLDKPLAGTTADGRRIIDIARRANVRVWSASSLPFAPGVLKTAAKVPNPVVAHAYGPMGDAPAGDSLVWYGVHTFETLLRLLGPGAETVRAVENGTGVVAVVDCADGRRGVAECIRGMWAYGGRAQNKSGAVPFTVDTGYLYRDLLRRVRAFFRGGEAPVSLPATFEGLAVMAAARESIETGQSARVESL